MISLRNSIFFIEIFSGLIAISACYLIYNYRHKPGAIVLMSCCVTAGIYGLMNAFSGIVGNSISLLLFYLSYPVGVFITYQIFIFTLEYTDHDLIRSEFIHYTVFIPLLSLILVIFTYLTSNTEVIFGSVIISAEGGTIYQDTTLIWLLFNIPAIFFSTSGIILLIFNSFNSMMYRKQLFLFCLGFIFGMSGFIIDLTTGVFPNYYTTTVTGISLGILIIAVTVREFDALSTTPINWRNVVDDTDYTVIVIDNKNKIVDISPGEDIGEFSVNQKNIGSSFYDLFSDEEEIINSIENNKSIIKCVCINGEERFIKIKSSIIWRDGGFFSKNQIEVGKVISFQDVSVSKRREEDLNLVSTVLSRVLRHNIRNDLNVIRGNIDMMIQNSCKPNEESEIVFNKIDNIISISKKVRRVEQIINKEFTINEIILADVVSKSISNINSEFPEAKINYNVSKNICIEETSIFVFALEEVISNTFEHNDLDSVESNIYTEISDDELKLIIEDNGCGIPDHELNTVKNGVETELNHNSGVGLWLIDIVTRRSNVQTDIESTDNGTKYVFSWDKFRIVENKENINKIEFDNPRLN